MMEGNGQASMRSERLRQRSVAFSDFCPWGHFPNQGMDVLHAPVSVFFMSAFCSNRFSGGSGPTMLALVLLVALLGACTKEESSGDGEATSDSETGRVDSLTVDEVLRADQRFSMLVRGLDSTGLDSMFSGSGTYTLFAPPDTAFKTLPTGTMPVLLDERRQRLRTILRHHMVDGPIRSEQLADTPILRTLSGDSIQVQRVDSTISIENARVIERDVGGSNGVIHVIDRVIRPPTDDEQ